MVHRAGVWPLALSAVLALTVGCSGSSPGSTAVSSPSATAASATGGGPASASTNPLPAGTFANPILTADMPDPAILKVGNIFHLYTTQNARLNVQTATSTDLVTWTIGPDALPTVGQWATPGKTWAPEVIAVGGRFVMMYTAADTASGKQCIGRAESASPVGPFIDRQSAPLVCQDTLGGSIDPNPVVMGSKIYLYWKNDGNCCGKPVHLWGQAMNASASALTGQPTPLLTNTKEWQGNLVEAPEMFAHDGRYYLFYAANDYASTSYAEGSAACTTPLGPCVDSANPLLTSDTAAAGPGHGFILQVGNQTWIVYHAWPPDAVGSLSPGRQLWLDPITWSAAGPVMTGPDAKAQARPKF